MKIMKMQFSCLDYVSPIDRVDCLRGFEELTKMEVKVAMLHEHDWFARRKMEVRWRCEFVPLVSPIERGINQKKLVVASGDQIDQIW